jgi:hypothetical protein
VPPTVEPRTIDLPPLCVRASVSPSSINDEQRTVDVTFSTGAPVTRFDWETGERYIERLSMDPAHMRLDRINSGGPVLDSHSGYRIANVLGVVEDGTAKVAGKKGVATLRFSRRPEVNSVWTDVRDRVLRNVSVGYYVHAYEERAGKDGGLKTRTAVDWEPYEISMVPMPADVGAQTRDGKPPAGTLNPCRIVTRGEEPAPQETTMPEEIRQSETVAEDNPLTPPHTPRMAIEPQTPPEPTDHERGAQIERERVQGIIEGCLSARMPQSLQKRLIDDGTSLVEAQAIILRELRGRSGEERGPQSGAVADIRVGQDPFVHVRAGIVNALQHRIAPSFFKLEDVGREYRAMSMMDVAKAYLNARGVRTTMMPRLEIAGLALGLDYRAGYHTTSDFALLLADVARKTLRAAYAEVPQTFLPIAMRTTLSDFKPSRRLQLGNAPNLELVKEHGEFTRGTIGEARETMQLDTYGRVFAITRQALINDDTDAFSRVPTAFGRSARKKESDIVWSQITSNPTMGDNNALFSAAHGNLQTDGDVISVASLSRARLAMRLQQDLDGDTFVEVVPRYLIVPPSLETVAEQIVAPLIGAQTITTQNIFAGKLTVIVEPRLEANSSQAWYLAAAKEQIPVLEYAYLEGEEGPSIENRVGFDVDGLEIKCRLDFDAAPADWRGIHKDPGENVS